MVLTQRVGCERSYPVELMLYVVTFGLYGIYWHYTVQHEVYRQFEVDKDGRAEGTLWLLYSRVFFPLIWAYQFVFVSNVHHVAHRLGLPKRFTPGRMLGLTIPGSVLMFTGSILLVFALNTGAIALADDATLQELDAVGADQEAAAGQALIFAAIGGPVLVTGIVLQVVAYATLQANVNRLWVAYGHRMVELSAAHPAGRPGGPAPAPPTPRTPAGGLPDPRP